MNERRTRETRHVWLCLAIAVCLIVYRLAFRMPEDLRHLVGASADSRVITWAADALLLGLFVLLWVAYRRWMAAEYRESKLTDLVGSISSDVVMVVDPHRVVIECNSTVRDMFGFEPEEIVGRGTDVLYPDRRVSGGREVHDAVKRFGFHVGMAMGRRRDGTEVPLEIITNPLQGRKGVVLLIRDVTERRRAEAAILTAKDAAEEANRKTASVLSELQQNYARLKELEKMKENLTHMIVHDLKSPLTSIILQLEMIQRRAGTHLDEVSVRYLHESGRLSRRLANMINCLLDVNRLQQNRMPINPDLWDLRPVAEEAVTVIRPDAVERSVSIHAPTGSALAYCDRDITCRVIVNLLGNSVKYTPDGGDVRVETASDGLRARVSVIDTGCGIPPEYHQKIFDPFVQVEAKEFSTGLGLTFCKLAIETQGGEIHVESEQGKGSTFWFLLPAKPHGASGT